MNQPENGRQDAATQGRRRNRRAVRQGVEVTTTDEKVWENDERAWGDVPEDRDAQLRRDVPPHWS